MYSRILFTSEDVSVLRNNIDCWEYKYAGSNAIYVSLLKTMMCVSVENYLIAQVMHET
jgi:hypothetical protein